MIRSATVQPTAEQLAPARRILLLGGTPETHALIRHLVGVAVPECRVMVEADWDTESTAAGPRLRSFELVLVDGIADREAAFGMLEVLVGAADVPPRVLLVDDDGGPIQARAAAAGAELTLARHELSVASLGRRLRALCRARPRAGAQATNRRARRLANASPLERLPTAEYSPASAPDVPGYSAAAEIGRGGMATVWLARRLEDDAAVVLKVLQVREADNAVSLRRFLREFRIAARLEHPNIVATHERAFAADYAYIAMEYCSGGDLSRRIRDGLTGDEVLEYTYCIASALDAAHSSGVVHRDVKPANVLFRADGSLALTDFGIAKAKEAAVALTMADSLVGTPHYVSPEQVAGDDVDNRADLYALGVMLYEMLTGERPFHGERLVDLLHAHVQAPIPRLPREHAHWQPFVDRLMAKRPGDRFASAAALLDALCDGI